MWANASLARRASRARTRSACFADLATHFLAAPVVEISRTWCCHPFVHAGGCGEACGGTSKLMMKKPAFTLFALLGTSTLLTLAACESGSNSVTPDAGGTIDSGTGADTGPTDDGGGDGGIVSECKKPTGGPTQHDEGTLTGDVTWTADKSPHVIPNNLAVSGTLTIEPCAEVLLGSQSSLTVNASGKLIANGAPTKRIHIAAQDPTKKFARLATGGGGTLRFAYVDIENGGHPQNSVIDVTGTIHAQGIDQTQPTQEIVFVDNVVIKDSGSNGLFLDDGAGFAAGSKDLVVTGAANYVMSLSTRNIGSIPPGKYTGNKIDEIVTPAGGGADAVQEDTTLHNRGVPYRIGNSLTFGYLTVHKDPGFATLTIEPGTILRFKPGGELIVEVFSGDKPAHGALVAVGTAAQPIVFTSASPTPAPGDWIGISFNSVPQPNDKIQYARVEYAGGLTGSGSYTCNAQPPVPDAAIKVRGEPTSAFVTNTTIVKSAAHGIDRGWMGDVPYDFLPTNTFTDVVACNQTLPRPNPPATCPDPVPCPK